MMVSRYLFAYNFKKYIHQVDLEKVQSLVPTLQEEYRAHGNWEALKTDRQRWMNIVNDVPKLKAHAFPPPKDMPPGGPPRVSLMDAKGQSVAGPPGSRDESRLVAIDVDGQIVGWLGLDMHEPLKKGPPAALLERQARQLYLVGGVVIGLTALIAFLFSRHLLRPIKNLTRGTRDLANRDFTVRIVSSTRDELGQLAENFNAMARTLESFEKMRQQWLTDISHELRTPLAVLHGEIEALQDGIREPTPPNLASLHAEVTRLNKLVEDLHLLSMADSDRLFLKKQWISPYRVLEKIVESYQARLSRCKINLDLLLDGIREILILADADRLGQVFANILENACKYVRSPGHLKISGQANDHFLTLNFEDSGPGVPKDALPRLFDRLYRADSSRNRDSGGSGLGTVYLPEYH